LLSTKVFITLCCNRTFFIKDKHGIHFWSYSP
jgi:hypothetical protein